ncbi:MAG: MBL fold metallo-hydrolase [Chloroflexota bacterium]|nr:MBL fold metallo-hydrolase [Chloroflexota bacterium]
MRHPARLTYVGHSTVLLELDGARLLTDPVLRDRVGPLRRQAPTVPPAVYRDVDAVLISHLHWDHLDLPSLRLLRASTPLIVPRGAAGALRRRGFAAVEELAVGEWAAVKHVRVQATPANHGGMGNPIAPGAAALGFVVSGSHSIYFAGDTDLFEGMADLAETLDAALLPVWGWGPVLGPGHLDPARAATALRLLRPRVALPIHWGTLSPIGVARIGGRWLSEPPRAFARHAATVAPHVEVRVLTPGAFTVLT